MADRGIPVAIAHALEDEAAAASATARERVSDEISVPTHEEIAELAYSYWEARGGHGGSPWEDWLRAERELMQKER
jgi:hypothetical protein